MSSPEPATATSPSPSGPLVSYRLRVTAGASRGAVVAIDAGAPVRVLIGSSAACTLALTDRRVSRRHLALEVHERGLRVTDLGSTNGTFINGLRIESAFAFVGSEIQIGDTVLDVSASEGTVAAAPSSATRFGRVLGSSPAMRRLFPLCERIATATMPVIIEGETGTGKELLAEALHEEGPRAQGPFLVFDCAAVPASAVASTLFGGGGEPGLLEQAAGGTLLIDEVGELEASSQAAFLRAIGNGDAVRIIAATRRNLENEVQAGRLREDLFFRLAGARIELPPLRDRTGDVELLTRHFHRELGAGAEPLTSETIARLTGYLWPGNVRELRNAVVRSIALGELGRVGVSSTFSGARVPDFFTEVMALDLPLTRAREKVALAFERVYVLDVLKRFDGNISRAAAASGIARRHFYTIIARHK